MKRVMLFMLLSTGFAATAFFTGPPDTRPVPIAPSPQRVGDSAAGYQYLITGNYVRSGLPYNLFRMGMGNSKSLNLGRTGANAQLPYSFTAVTAADGKVLVAPNCLQCHAQVFEGQLVIGLGNSNIDFTGNELNPQRLQALQTFLKATAPKMAEAAAPFITVTKTVAPYLKADVPGVNMADRLAAVLAAHRDPVSFAWLGKPALDLPTEAIPTDTPPWWLLKKKNAMFYTGFGRGDFGRFLMASNLLTVNDTTESAEVDGHMPDLLAYLYSLKPPAYPKAVDTVKAATGRAIFQTACSGCHGGHGDLKKAGSELVDGFPNLLIPEAIIQTDSLLYQSNYSNPQFIDWFNRSWFTTGNHPAQLVPFSGYIAPPLDGIWVTAPYLHNGSVPTLEALLNSKLRPRYWRRDFKNPVYDYERIGWVYESKEQPGTGVYNTDKPGYGNSGHYFGDKLSDGERDAVIEYLKTL